MMAFSKISILVAPAAVFAQSKECNTRSIGKFRFMPDCLHCGGCDIDATNPIVKTIFECINKARTNDLYWVPALAEEAQGLTADVTTLVYEGFSIEDGYKEVDFDDAILDTVKYELDGACNIEDIWTALENETALLEDGSFFGGLAVSETEGRCVVVFLGVEPVGELKVLTAESSNNSSNTTSSSRRQFGSRFGSNNRGSRIGSRFGGNAGSSQPQQSDDGWSNFWGKFSNNEGYLGSAARVMTGFGPIGRLIRAFV